MNKFNNPLLAILALVVVTGTQAAIKLVYTTKGETVEVVAFKDGKILGRTEKGIVVMPETGVLTLEGSDWMEDHRVLLTPELNINRGFYPDAIEPYPRPYTVGVNIHNQRDWEDRNPGLHGDMIHGWKLHPDEKTLAVIIWQSEKGTPQITHQVLLPANLGWFSEKTVVENALELGQTKGHAGLLLLGSDGYATPYPEFSDPDSQAALQSLLHDNQSEFDSLLLRKPAIAREKSYTGATLLHYAALLDCPWAIESWHRSTGNLNAKDEVNATPLEWGARLNRSTFVQQLLANGASPDVGYALHEAIRCGHEEITRQLISAKVDVDRDNQNNEAPLIVAFNNNRGAIARLLLEKKPPTD